MPGRTAHFPTVALGPLFRLHNQRDGFVDSHKAIMTALEARASVAQPGKRRGLTFSAYDWKSSRERIDIG